VNLFLALYLDLFEYIKYDMATYKILVGKPEGTRPLGRKRKWVDNIKMDLREIG
jgi:hypothetical protein